MVAYIFSVIPYFRAIVKWTKIQDACPVKFKWLALLKIWEIWESFDPLFLCDFVLYGAFKDN